MLAKALLDEERAMIGRSGLAAIVALVSVWSAAAHPGGTNAQGCHCNEVDRDALPYHCHSANIWVIFERNEVRSLQFCLKEKSLYQQQLDGIMGADTLCALRSYLIGAARENCALLQDERHWLTPQEIKSYQQRQDHLENDGAMGRRTLASIINDLVGEGCLTLRRSAACRSTPD